MSNSLMAKRRKALLQQEPRYRWIKEDNTLLIEVPPYTGRLKKRTVPHTATPLTLPVKDGQPAPAVKVRVGGTVPLAYGADAWTEGSVQVTFPSGLSVLWLVEVPALRATKAKVVRAILGEAAAVAVDQRYSPDHRAAARQTIIDAAAAVANRFLGRADHS